jgi:hypothetical protein
VADASLPWWATLVPVGAAIIGGVIALAGGWVADHRRDTAEKKQRRAEKFEELVTSLYEYDRWLENMRGVQVFGAQQPPELASPFAKIEAIAAVYFPQFTNQIDIFSLEATKYSLWMAAAGKKRLRGLTDQLDAGFEAAYEPYLTARSALMRDLRNFAQTEFQPDQTSSLLSRLTECRKRILGR